MSEPSARSPRPPGPWRPRVRDVVLALVFTFGWLIPVAAAAIKGGPLRALPNKLRDFYSVSCLFGDASARISVFYVQVWRDGARGWEDFDERELFRLEPFGHRTRFDRFMARFGYHDRAEPARRELALWLAQRDRELRPDAPRVVRVRYLWTDVHIDPEHPPTGRWRKRPRRELGAVPMKQLGKVVIIGGEP